MKLWWASSNYLLLSFTLLLNLRFSRAILNNAPKTKQNFNAPLFLLLHRYYLCIILQMLHWMLPIQCKSWKLYMAWHSQWASWFHFLAFLHLSKYSGLLPTLDDRWPLLWLTAFYWLLHSLCHKHRWSRGMGRPFAQGLQDKYVK